MQNDKKKTYGILATLIFHGILVILLFSMSFYKTETIFPDPEGIQVDFGELIQGEESNSQEDNTSIVKPEQQNQESQMSESSNDVVTQDNEDAITVKKNNNQNTQNQNTELTQEELERIKREEQQKQIDAKFKSNTFSDNPGNSTTGKKSGTPGDPKGSGTTGNKRGTPGNPYGNGDATSWVKPTNTKDCNKPISLTVQIDAYGNVIKIVDRETALSEQACVVAAENAAKKVKFPSEPSATGPRYAIITYDYTVSQGN